VDVVVVVVSVVVAVIVVGVVAIVGCTFAKLESRRALEGKT